MDNTMTNPVVEYHENGKVKYNRYYYYKLLNREDGPAIECYSMYGIIMHREWFSYDKVHNFDGPAKVWYDKTGEIMEFVYYIFDKELSLNSWLPKSSLTYEQQIEYKLKYG